MDPGVLLPLVSSLVATAVAYLRDEAAKKAGAKAAEVIGEKAGAAVSDIGPRVLTTMRAWFRTKGVSKAQQALTLVEHDPDDPDYQEKLVKETTRLAAAEPRFARELRVLAERAVIVEPGGVAIENQAPNYGAQGVFNAPVSFDHRKA